MELVPERSAGLASLTEQQLAARDQLLRARLEEIKKKKADAKPG